MKREQRVVDPPFKRRSCFILRDLTIKEIGGIGVWVNVLPRGWGIGKEFFRRSPYSMIPSQKFDCDIFEFHLALSGPLGSILASRHEGLATFGLHYFMRLCINYIRWLL